MPIPFYDNQNPSQNSTIANIDRVYCVDWKRLEDSHWKSLEQLYPTLPGWQGYHEVPYWFGHDDNAIPHLYLSVEPTGFHVCGSLSVSEWLNWLSHFEPGIANFPSYQCE